MAPESPGKALPLHKPSWEAPEGMFLERCGWNWLHLSYIRPPGPSSGSALPWISGNPSWIFHLRLAVSSSLCRALKFSPKEWVEGASPSLLTDIYSPSHRENIPHKWVATHGGCRGYGLKPQEQPGHVLCCSPGAFHRPHRRDSFARSLPQLAFALSQAQSPPLSAPEEQALPVLLHYRWPSILGARVPPAL